MSPDYLPARWLRGPHTMTVFASVFRPFPRPRARRERWELEDGDFIDVDRFPARPRSVGSNGGDPDRPGAPASQGPAPEAPVLVVCHGLEGSSRAPYVLGLVAVAQAHGIAAVALNFRGCSGPLNRLPRFYHSGDTDDLAVAVERLAAEAPRRPILLAGFSLGGNVVVKYLGERGEAAPPQVCGAAVISVPFDLARCARALDGGGFWNWIYRGRFLRRLRGKVLLKARRFPGAFDLPAVRAATTFAAFDDAVTARLHGFASAEDYWTRCSAGRFVSGVRRPLLAISALDDPLVPPESLPLEEARANRHVSIVATTAGGHVGFVAGPPLWPSYWAEARAVEFLATVAAAASPQPAPPAS